MSDEASVVELKADMRVVKETLHKLEGTMERVLRISESVAAIQMRQEQHQQDLGRTNKDVEKLSGDLTLFKREIEQRIDTRDQKFSAFQSEVQAVFNQGKGVIKTATVVWAVVGTLLIGGFAWTAKAGLDLRQEFTELKIKQSLESKK